MSKFKNVALIAFGYCLCMMYNTMTQGAVRRRVPNMPLVREISLPKPNIIPTLEATPEPTRNINHNVPCKTLDSLYPGRIDWGIGNASANQNVRIKWVPDQCKLPAVLDAEIPPSDIRRCLSKVKVAWFGDSLSRNVVQDFGAFALNATETTLKKQFLKPQHNPRMLTYVDLFIMHNNITSEDGLQAGKFDFMWQYHATSEGTFDLPYAKDRVREADYVLLGGGMWDMSSHVTPLVTFYEKHKKRVQDIKALMKPGAEMILFPMYWLSHKKTRFVHGADSPPYLCNHPVKASYYRKALAKIADCVPGVSVLDVTEITRHAHGLTTDGYHYTSPATRMIGDVMYNHICNGLALRPGSTCDEDAAKAHWATIKEARMTCPGPLMRGPQSERDLVHSFFTNITAVFDPQNTGVPAKRTAEG
eukprot:TRINITY_DN9390_c0_g1_i1.p1 TRINITY_DN9390_c0_g1~~TRINITY_DN9390_c0_g1_i1.p1  ORF type:complete len:418 (+),score=53.53 TRINITY_DN9390_c0_g1_i1:43-1296(+)